MADAKARAIDLILARRRDQTPYAGVKLGVFEAVGEYRVHAVEIADQLEIDRDNGYRRLADAGWEYVETHFQRMNSWDSRSSARLNGDTIQ